MGKILVPSYSTFLGMIMKSNLIHIVLFFIFPQLYYLAKKSTLGLYYMTRSCTVFTFWGGGE